MSSAAYTHLVRDMDLPDLLMQADFVRELDDHLGWKLVMASLDAHGEKLLAQLLNPTAKPEDVDRLRGEIRGLSAAREAAESIVSLAVDREAEAKRAHQAQEQFA